MIVLKKIGPTRMNGFVHRFAIGQKLTGEQVRYFTGTKQIDELKKAGIIGEKASEPIRSEPVGQSGHPDESGRTEPGNDDNEPVGAKRPGKRKAD